MIGLVVKEEVEEEKEVQALSSSRETDRMTLE